MELIFLGTSSGTPTKTRNVSGLAVLDGSNKSWCLVDCGEGTQHQLLHTKLSARNLQAIFITHVHGDHCYGLPGLLASIGMPGRQEALKIIAPLEMKLWFEQTKELTQLHLPFEIEFIQNDKIDEVDLGFMSVTVTELSHRVPSYAYTFCKSIEDRTLNKDKLNAEGIPQGPLWGKVKHTEEFEFDGKILKSSDFLVEENINLKIIVGGDNDKPELLEKDAECCNVLVHESTFTKDIAIKVGERAGHSYAEQVAQFAEEAKIPNLLLSHFSPRYKAIAESSPSMKDIEYEARAIYNGNLFLAEDFAHYRLKKTGEFEKLN